MRRRFSQRGIVGFPLLLALLGASLLGVAGFALVGERDRFESVTGLRAARDEVDNAMLGFIGAFRRLPCPDTSVPRDGFEDCVAGIQRAGAVPYASLGLSGRQTLHLSYAAYGGSAALDLTSTAVAGNLREVDFPEQMPVTPAEPAVDSLPSAPPAPDPVESSADQKAKIEAEYAAQSFYADLLTNQAVSDTNVGLAGLEIVSNRLGGNYPASLAVHLESSASYASASYDFTRGTTPYNQVESVVAGAMRFLSAHRALDIVKTMSIDLNDLASDVQAVLNGSGNDATKLSQLATRRNQWQAYVDALDDMVTGYNARTLASTSSFQPVSFAANSLPVVTALDGLYALAADNLAGYDYTACGAAPLPDCPTGSASVSSADVSDLADSSDPLVLGRGLLKAISHTAEQASKRAQKLKETASAARGSSYQTTLETIGQTSADALDPGVVGSPAAQKAAAMAEMDTAMASFGITGYSNPDGSLNAFGIAELDELLAQQRERETYFTAKIAQLEAELAVETDPLEIITLNFNLSGARVGLSSAQTTIAEVEGVFADNEVVIGTNTLIVVYTALEPKLAALEADWYCRATSGSDCVADEALQYYLDLALAAVGGAVPGADEASATAQFSGATQPSQPNPDASRSPTANPSAFAAVGGTNEVNLADFCEKLDRIDAAGSPSLRISTASGAKPLAYLLVDHGADRELDTPNDLGQNGGLFAAVDRAHTPTYDDKTYPVRPEYLRRTLGCTALRANFRSFDALVDDIDLLYTDATNVRDEAEQAVVTASIDLVLAGARLAVDIGAIIQESAGGAVATTVCIASLGFAANFCAAAGFEFAAAAAHGAVVAGDAVNIAAAALALSDAVDGRNGARATVNDIRGHYQDVVDAVKAADVRGGLTEAN